ncbi:hypothetical protein [Microbacterium soli]|uniref:Uncharacterized protein n=1 Tax=Microbacterium soli TaxID=446075 RepID=A0ABP7N1N8_9MICO
MYTDDDFDNLLNGSSPVRGLMAEERRAVAIMVDESAPPKSPRRNAQPIAIGAIVVAFLGCGGAAAAAVTGIWAPWAQDDALATLHYELPSGVSCEMRIGNVKQAPPEVSDLIRKSLVGVEFKSADVIENATPGDSKDVLTDDNAYQDAYNWTVATYIDDALKAHGIDNATPQFSAQANCE